MMKKKIWRAIKIFVFSLASPIIAPLLYFRALFSALKEQEQEQEDQEWEPETIGFLKIKKIEEDKEGERPFRAVATQHVIFK